MGGLPKEFDRFIRVWNIYVAFPLTVVGAALVYNEYRAIESPVAVSPVIEQRRLDSTLPVAIDSVLLTANYNPGSATYLHTSGALSQKALSVAPDSLETRVDSTREPI